MITSSPIVEFLRLMTLTYGVFAIFIVLAFHDEHGRVYKLLRWSSALTSVLLMTIGAVDAQQNGGEGPASEAFWKWAIVQGGLALVVLVGGWSYRRDLMRLVREGEERITVLTSLAERSASAMQSAADATREQSAAIERLAQAVKDAR